MEEMEKEIDRIFKIYSIGNFRNMNENDWETISRYEKLSEEFIENFLNEVNWFCICKYQKLSEEFIEKHSDKVYWEVIYKFQKLSEEFIERHMQQRTCWIYWVTIFTYQKLSETFIEKYAQKEHWDCISKYQKLSKEFIERHKLTISEDNWMYKDKNYKLNYIKNNTCYEVIDDEYIVAYKSVRNDNYSVYNFQYKYEVGGIYEAHCDCNLDNDNSFGLSAWNREDALEYHNYGKLLKVKIMIEDIGVIVWDNDKIRCRRLEVLEEVCRRLEVFEEVK